MEQAGGSSTVVSEGVMLTELERVIELSRETRRPLAMFSAGIDAVWHRLIETGEAYRRFCTRVAGGPVQHVQREFRIKHDPNTPPENESEHLSFDWIPLYERRYGPLSLAWFAKECGSVDVAAFERYQRDGCVDASWSCGVETGGHGDDW